MKYHEPVMGREVIDYLLPAPGKKFIDCTVGDAGHSVMLAQAGAKVLGLDVSDVSIKRAQERIKELGLETKIEIKKGNFKNLEQLVIGTMYEKVDGILFDLGYSSFQLDESDIGLSFLNDTDLDMRMDDSLSVTAADLVNKLPQDQLSRIIFEYGGERMAKKIAYEIVKFRDLEKFHSTKQLAELIKNVTPSGYEKGRIHPATRTFQALRIAVNDELRNLELALPQAARVLLPGGRMGVISFHSLEDKIAKELGDNVQLMLAKVTKKPVVPTDQEINKNSRARSAKLRVYEKR